jgi:hypothetical protein
MAMLIALLAVAVNAVAAGAHPERGVGKQATFANLVAPLVARAHSSVTLTGSIGVRGTNEAVSSGFVVIQSRPAATTKWRTLGRLALKSDGTFVFKTRVGATGAHGVRNVHYRVLFTGDAAHRPSTQDCSTQIV